MAYGRKYYKEFDGYNAATRQTYSVLVDIYEDGFAGAAIEIEEISASPLQLSLDSSGDPLYTAIKKTSAAFNIINTNQFDYSEFYTSNAKKYKMMITSTVFNWTGYLVPQAVSFDLATNGEFTLTASDGLHLLQSIDYKSNENEMTTLAAFLADIETKIGLSTFNRTSTVSTEYGDIWNSLIYKGMLVGKTYEEAFEMVLKAIGMQVRYWKITPIISIESALQTASVKCTNEYPELNFLAPIKTAKLNRNITTLPSAFKNALVDDASDLKPRAANSYNTLTNWTVVSDNGLVVFDIGANETDRKANKYKYINMFVKPTNAPYDSQRLTGNEGSYFQLRPVQKTPFTLSFNANFGRISEYGRSSADGYRAYTHPVKWSSIKWGLYDSVSNKSFNKTSAAWDITGTPTAANANELKVTDPADLFVDVYIPIPAPTGLTANLRFYLFTGEVEYDSSAPGGSKTNRLSIQSIDIDGEYVVSENELYTAVNGAVAVGDNIDVLNYEVDFGYCPQPPLNTSLYYGSALFDNNLNQLEDIIIGANTVSHEQYLFNTILYTQNEIRKKVYTANVNILTNVSPFWLKTTLKTDTVMVNACSFDFKTSQLNGEFTEIMPYVYREWAITSESEIGSSDWGGSGGQTGGGSGGCGTVDTSNFVVKTGATDQTVEGIIRPDNLLSNGAVVAKSLAPTDVNEWPQAGVNVDGIVKYDGITIQRNANGQLEVIGGGGCGSDVAWGTPTTNYVPLTVNSVTRNLALDGHTHSYMPISGGNFTNPITVLGHTVWHAGNDGAGSGLDADTVDGFHIGSGSNWGYIPFVEVNGVMEIGKHVDFHSSSPNSVDYSTRLTAVGSSQNELYLPVNNGTLALITDNVASATKLANTRTIWGQNFNGEGDVNGNINIGSYSIDGTAGNVYFGGNFHIDSKGTYGLYLNWRNGTNTIINGGASQGNVLIGTATDAGYKLDVNGTFRATGSIYANVGVKSRNICIETDNNGNASAASSEINNYNSTLFLQQASSNNIAMCGGGGKVGIGTTDPQYKLDVNGTGRFRSSVLADGAVVAKYMAETYVPDFPIATANLLGLIKVGANLTIDANGVLSATGGGSGVSSFNDLTDKPTTLSGYGILASDILFDSKYAPTNHTHSQYLLSSSYTAADVLSKLLTVDGAGSGLDADTVDGVHIGSGSNWGYIPFVEVNGVMDIGKYIDFHSSSPNSVDYSTRLTAVGSSQNELYLPVSSGTLALITDNVASATKLANTRTIWGQTFNGEGDVSGAINNATTGSFSSTLFTSVGLKSRNICIETDNAGNAAAQSSEINNYNSSLFLQTSTSNNVVLVLGGGSVGVGTPSPSYKLDVNGSFRSVGAAYLNSTLSVTGASTFTGLLTANGGIGSTTGTFSSYVAAQRFYTGYDAGVAGSVSCSNWFRSNGSTGWYNDTYGAGILSDTANIVRTYSTNKFKVYNTSSDSIYTLGGVLANGAVVAKYLSSTYTPDYPIGSSSVLGTFKAGSSLISNAGTLDQRNRHYTTTTAYTDAAARDVTAKIPLGTGNMTSGTLDQIKLDFAPLATTFGLTANVIVTQTGAGAGLIVSFREDSGTGRWYICIYNPTGATVVRDGIYLSINAKQTV